MQGLVSAVCRSPDHSFSKAVQTRISLITGMGVAGDAHLGRTVKHRSRVKLDPDQPNLRQVHLIHDELHEELRQRGFDVSAGRMGENITTHGIALLALPTGALLHIGETAVLEVTGLRNPCLQLDQYQPGLMRSVLGRDEQGAPILRAGIMAIVLAGGDVRPGDPIRVENPPGSRRPLARV